MKLPILFLPSLPFLLSSCIAVADWETGRIGGNGVSVTEVRSLDAFTRVEVAGDMAVTVKTGADYAAYVSADENLICGFRTDVRGGALIIDTEYGIDPVVEPHITVIVPDLRRVLHGGRGEVGIEGRWNFPDLALELNSTGDLLFSGAASRLRLELNGSGRIEAEGYADRLEASLGGEGVIHAENLLAADADVNLSGVGNIYLDLDFRSVLTLSLTGTGTVEWWGSPARVDYYLTGLGQVVEHRGLPKQMALSKHAADAAGATSLPARVIQAAAVK